MLKGISGYGVIRGCLIYMHIKAYSHLGQQDWTCLTFVYYHNLYYTEDIKLGSFALADGSEIMLDHRQDRISSAAGAGKFP